LTTLSLRQAMDNRGLPNRAYLASAEHRLVCCAIPKNGCTTLKKWFLSFVDPAGLEAPDPHIYCAPRWVISLWEGPPRDEAFAMFFTLTFLREPLSRVASAYIEKFVGGHPYGYFEPAREVIEDLARMRGLDVQLDRTDRIQAGTRTLDVPASSSVDYTKGPTFREFAAYLCAAPDEHLDQHWRPQSAFIAGRRMDFLGRVSSMTAALTAISQARGYPLPPPPESFPKAESDGVFLGDLPAGEIYHRFLSSRGVLPATELLFDDDIRTRLLARFAADVDLYRIATDVPTSIPPLDTIRVVSRDETVAGSRI
jgi:hypothetical protein